jgi:hypothetical protein
MEGTPGSPEVASIMFEKIEKASIFIGDMTLVGKIPIPSSDEGDSFKSSINPNVAIEMGYAAGILGWDRVICVMNEYYGTRLDRPFDTRNRRHPIDFDLSPDAAKDREKNKKAIKELSKWIRKAIDLAEQSEFRKVSTAIGLLDIQCIHMLSTYSKVKSFPQPDNQAQPFTDSSKFNAVIVRLIELGLLKTDINPVANLYAYHWTYLGTKVIQKFFTAIP